MQEQKIEEKTKLYVLDIVKRTPLSFTRGEGAYLFGTDGRRYLDFLCGIAVTSLGHNHPDIVRVIQEQSKKLLHVSNLFYIPEQAELAEALIQSSFPGKAFFFNSGTEANEAAFKLCRRYGLGKLEKKDDAAYIISLKNSFHGRTTASMCLTGQEKIHNGFGPLLKEHIYVPPNDWEALRSEIEGASRQNRKICAFFVELIQGEGGIYPLDKEYVRQAYRLCKKHNILFAVDEVQTGMGRTGKLFCYEHYGFVPDLMTLAKALGSGFPIGALLVSQEYSAYLQRGQHGTTLGGNPLAARTALETLRIINNKNFLADIEKLSVYILKKLCGFQKKYSVLSEIRGMGFHIGMSFQERAADFTNMCLQNGLLLNTTLHNTVRIMPPLILNQKEADEGLDIIDGVLKKF